MSRFASTRIAIGAGVALLALAAWTWPRFAPVVPGDPIPDIDVTVEQIPPGPRLQTHTDAHGAFSFSLVAGTYLLHVGSRPTPVSAATAAVAAAPGGVSPGLMVSLPDSVAARGGWPYALRIVAANVTVNRVALAAPAPGAASQRTSAPAVRDVEIRLTVGSATGRPGMKYVLRGSVEARN